MNTNTFTEEMSDDQTLRGLTQNTFSSEDWNSNYYSNSIVSEDMSGEKCLEEPTQSSYKLDNTVSKTVDDSGFFDDFAEEDVLQCISQNGFNSNDVKEGNLIKNNVDEPDSTLKDVKNFEQLKQVEAISIPKIEIVKNCPNPCKLDTYSSNIIEIEYDEVLDSYICNFIES